MSRTKSLVQTWCLLQVLCFRSSKVHQKLVKKLNEMDSFKGAARVENRQLSYWRQGGSQKSASKRVTPPHRAIVGRVQ